MIVRGIYNQWCLDCKIRIQMWAWSTGKTDFLSATTFETLWDSYIRRITSDEILDPHRIRKIIYHISVGNIWYRLIFGHLAALEWTFQGEHCWSQREKSSNFWARNLPHSSLSPKRSEQITNLLRPPNSVFTWPDKKGSYFWFQLMKQLNSSGRMNFCRFDKRFTAEPSLTSPNENWEQRAGLGDWERLANIDEKTATWQADEKHTLSELLVSWGLMH